MISRFRSVGCGVGARSVSGFWVQGLGFRIQGVGFMVQVSGSGAWVPRAKGYQAYRTYLSLLGNEAMEKKKQTTT